MYCCACALEMWERVGDVVGMWASVWGRGEVGCLRERKEVTGGFVGGVISLWEDCMGRKRRSSGEMQQDIAFAKAYGVTLRVCS